MTDEQLGDAPVEPDFVENMNLIAGLVNDIFNEPGKPAVVGFVLMTFNFGDADRCNYMSNARRGDVIVLLKEQLARFEGMPEPKDPDEPH